MEQQDKISNIFILKTSLLNKANGEKMQHEIFLKA